jgi:hypothetical protein
MARTTTVKKSTIAKAEERRISAIGDIKQRTGGIIELPSGITVRWRNPGGLRAFMSQGKIPNALIGAVEQGLKGGKGASDKMAADVMKQMEDNPEMLGQLMEMYDSVAMKCLVEPKLWPVPTEEDLKAWNKDPKNRDDQLDDVEDLRYEDRLYVDELPDDDKAYLFSLLSGGVKDLETFRAERSISMDAVARVSGVVGHTVDNSGSDAG